MSLRVRIIATVMVATALAACTSTDSTPRTPTRVRHAASPHNDAPDNNPRHHITIRNESPPATAATATATTTAATTTAATTATLRPQLWGRLSGRRHR